MQLTYETSQFDFALTCCLACTCFFSPTVPRNLANKRFTAYAITPSTPSPVLLLTSKYGSCRDEAKLRPTCKLSARSVHKSILLLISNTITSSFAHFSTCCSQWSTLSNKKNVMSVMTVTTRKNQNEKTLSPPILSANTRITCAPLK